MIMANIDNSVYCHCPSRSSFGLLFFLTVAIVIFSQKAYYLLLSLMWVFVYFIPQSFTCHPSSYYSRNSAYWFLYRVTPAISPAIVVAVIPATVSIHYKSLNVNCFWEIYNRNLISILSRWFVNISNEVFCL